MAGICVIIPGEAFTVVEFVYDANFGIAEINQALVDFEPKVVFSWHFSIMVHYSDVDERSLPVQSELKALEEIERVFWTILQGADLAKPKGFF